MKQLFSTIVITTICGLCSLFGQTDSDSIYKSQLNNKNKSIFKSIDHGMFSGATNGYVQLQNGNDTIVLDFQTTNTSLKITKDPYEVYDNSTKKYTTQTTSGKTTLTYEVYAFANVFTINLNGSTYDIGIIDGASDTPISGLSFNYCSENNIEYLTLFVTKPLELTTTRELMRTKNINYSDAKKIAKSVTVLPGTTLILTVKK